MRARRWLSVGSLVLAGVLVALASPPAPAQPVGAAPAAPSPTLAADLREDVQRLAVTVSDAYGRRETVNIPLTLYRPPGDGPFPLAVLAHGRSSERRSALLRERFEWLSRYLVAKGFAVAVPTRAGYGESAGLFDPEESGNCNSKGYEAMADVAADQLLAVVAHARTLAWVDASRWIVVGQSLGGTAAMATAARAPQGLVAAINFSGGAGGHPVTRVANPCSPHLLERLWRTQAATTPLPVLWIYWTHDLYWGERLPRDWAQAWRNGGGRIDFHALPPWRAEPVDGHGGLLRDMDHWVPLVEAHLAQAGFTRPGQVQRPPPSAHARLDEPDKLPLKTAQAREQALARFIAARKPRALAVGPGGHYGWATGDWAAGRALGHCGASGGVPCKLYAVDDDVVWVP